MSKGDGITDDDRALFRRAVGDVRRIEDDRAPPQRTRVVPRPRERTSDEAADARGLVESEWTPEVEPGDVLSFSRGGVRRREMKRLRGGRIPIEAELDLHGRVVADAAVALDHFLADSLRRGRRCVRIVHGKGFGSRGGQSVMKAQVVRWLGARPEVLAFCSAPPALGGTGALHVLLGRRQSPPGRQSSEDSP